MGFFQPLLAPVICCLAIQGVWIGLLRVLDLRLQGPAANPLTPGLQAERSPSQAWLQTGRDGLAASALEA